MNHIIYTHQPNLPWTTHNLPYLLPPYINKTYQPNLTWTIYTYHKLIMNPIHIKLTNNQTYLNPSYTCKHLPTNQTYPRPCTHIYINLPLTHEQTIFIIYILTYQPVNHTYITYPYLPIMNPIYKKYLPPHIYIKLTNQRHEPQTYTHGP